MAEQERATRDRISRFTRRLFGRTEEDSRSRSARGRAPTDSADPESSEQASHEENVTEVISSGSGNVSSDHAQSRDEYGVRQRVPPPGLQSNTQSPFDIDIVAVHGLGGHALKTWTGKNKKIWLIDEDFLPRTLSTARILTFGYNANNFTQEVSSKVMDHADALLAGLLAHRMGNENRPIIFIAHSLGGIVVKEALTTNRPEYRSIVHSTSSIVFLGTPHHGSELAGYLGIAKNLAAWAQLERSPRSKLHLELKPFSDTIRSVNSRFTNPANRYIMRSFAEQKPMQLPPPLGSQLIVPQGSALLGHPNELPVPVYANHSTICKFESPEDDTYFSICQQLVFLKDMAMKRLEEVDVENDELVRRFNALAVPGAAYAARSCRHFEVPYLSTAEVFGSQAILDRVKDHFEVDFHTLQNAPRCVVLYGMGGVGKSTLAHTYATIFRNNYEGVFWSSARETGGVAGLDAVKLDFLKWARTIGTSFVEWANTPDRKWLLVIDNFDDLSGAGLQQFRETVPQGIIGHIIVTSRRLRATVFGTHSIRVEPLPPADAVPMLLAFSFNRAKTSRDEAIARDIVTRLGGLPLAIRHCAAYANKLQLRLADYPERIQTLLETIDTGLDFDDPEISSQSGEDSAEYQTLFATGELSFHQLLESSPLAADVLTIMAYLDASDIAEAILSRGFQGVGGWDDSGNWKLTHISTLQCASLHGLLQSERPVWELSRALATLVDFSLIQRTSNSSNFCLHPVTQYWLMRRSRDRSTQILSDALSIIEHGFPEPDPLDFHGILNACSHPYLWDYKMHVRALLTSIAGPRSSVSHEICIIAMRLSIKAYFIFVARVRGDEGVWLNKSLMNALFTRVDVPLNLWFRAVATMIDELREDFVFPRDIFRDLPELTFAGSTWTEQRGRLQQSEVDLSSRLQSFSLDSSKEDGDTTPSGEQTEVDTPTIHIPFSRTREDEEAAAVRATIEAEGHVEFRQIAITSAMFVPIDPVLTKNGDVIPSVSVEILRFVCGLAWWWQSYRNEAKPHDTGVILDSRDGYQQLGFVLNRYFGALGARDFSDHERYHIARVMQLMAHTQHATENPDWRRTCLKAAVNSYNGSVGLAFDRATMAVQDLVLMDAKRGDIAAVEADIEQFTAMGIGMYNFPMHRALTLYHGDVLTLNNMPLRRIEVYETELKRFREVPLHMRQYWEFYNDPILDIHEELILCYGTTPNKEAELARCVNGYIEYAEQTYEPPPFPDPMELWTYRNFLGFGIGSRMREHPFGRQRIYVDWRGDDSPKSITFVLDNMERAAEEWVIRTDEVAATV